MTYIYHVLKDGPIGLWSFDSTPLNDSSGYGNNATYTGSPTTTRPIVAGGVAAQHVDSGDTINYPVSSVMIQGRETRAFSLEAWIKPQSGTAAIIARDDSGLFLDGLALRFSMQFSDLISVTYNNLDAGEIYHVVATYDGKSMILYLNGSSVVSTEIDESQIAAGIGDSSASLRTTMSSSMVIDTPSVYNYAIDYVRVIRHYNMGVSYPQVINLSLNNGGKYYTFSDYTASVYSDTSFGKADDWNLGTFTGNIAEVDGRLVNLYDETSEEWLTGTWTYQFSIDGDTGSGIELNGSRITWDSPDTIIVEVSEDDATWTTVTNGASIVGTQDLSAGYAIAVRVTIPTTPTKQAVVDSLRIVFYTDKTIKGSDESLPASFDNPLAVTLSGDAYPPAAFNDNAGVLLPASNGVTIPADTDFDPYTAVEITARVESSVSSKTLMSVGGATITTNGSGQWTFSGLSALYIDGVAVTSPYTLPTGKWHHVLAVFPGATAPVIIGTDYPMRLGYVALYTNEITASDAGAIYDTWVGMAAAQIFDESTSNISEHVFSDTASSFRAYAYNWAITGAG